MSWEDAFQEEPMDVITMKSFEDLCQAFADKKEVIKGMEEQMKILNEELHALEQKIIKYMGEFKKVKHFGSYGTISISGKFSWTVPKDDDSRIKFFGYLKDKGVFENLITVHSATLNKFCNDEINLAKEDGNIGFKIPGLAEPTYYERLSLRR